MSGSALDSALERARAVVGQPSVPYDDQEEALRQLVEAVESDLGGSIRADLVATAANASRKARSHATNGASNPTLALRWAEVAKVSLAAIAETPATVPEIDEDTAQEMEAIGEAMADLRGQVASAGGLLIQMRGEFSEAGTPVAQRWADRIASVLDEMDYRADVDEGGPDAER